MYSAAQDAFFYMDAWSSNAHIDQARRIFAIFCAPHHGGPDCVSMRSASEKCRQSRNLVEVATRQEFMHPINNSVIHSVREEIEKAGAGATQAGATHAGATCASGIVVVALRWLAAIALRLSRGLRTSLAHGLLGRLQTPTKIDI